VEIICNTDKRYTFLNKDYILIIKNEPEKPCCIYISDCEEAVWYKLVDLNFFATLKRELQLTSPLRVFAAHFIQSLLVTSHLEKDRSAVKLSIELEIGEGLVMSSILRIENRVHYNNPDEFKKSLKRFIMLLWEVKHAQLGKQKQIQQFDQL
jgi:hypothetical protein